MAVTISNVTIVRDLDFSEGDLTGTKNFNVFFTGEVNSFSDYDSALEQIFAHPSIPNIGDKYGNFESYADDVRARPHQGQNLYWKVEVSYEPLDEENGGGGAPSKDDPTDRLVVYTWGSKTIQETLYEDRDFRPIVMSSGEAPNSLPVVDKHILTCTVTRTTKSYDPTEAVGLIGCINDATFRIKGKSFPTGTVKLISWGATEQTNVVTSTGASSGAVKTDAETISFEIQDTPWVGKMLDQGLVHYWDYNVKNKLDAPNPILKDGRKVLKPVALDGDGVALSISGEVRERELQVPTHPGVTAIVTDAGVIGAMLLFRFWEEKSFSPLGRL